MAVKIHTRYKGEIVKVNYLECGFPGKLEDLYMVGNEYGPTDLICALSLGDAWDEWLDNEPAIDDHDLFMAYGFDNPDQYNLACKLDDPAVYLKSLGLSEDFTIVEGYEYMPNFGSTNGIVDVSEYQWIRPYLDCK